jgi:hypothetical protein
MALGSKPGEPFAPSSCATCFYKRPVNGQNSCCKAAPHSASTANLAERSSTSPGLIAQWLEVQDDFYCGEFSLTDPQIYGPLGHYRGPDAACSNCFYGRTLGGNLSCVRLSPQSVNNISDVAPSLAQWLQVDPSWWCGWYSEVDPNIYQIDPQQIYVGNLPVIANEGDLGFTRAIGGPGGKTVTLNISRWTSGAWALQGVIVTTP